MIYLGHNKTDTLFRLRERFLKKTISAIFFLFGLVPSAFSTDAVKIEALVNNIRGFTLTPAISYTYNLEVGDEFPTLEDLDDRLAEIRQKLWNKRYFKTLEVNRELLPDGGAKVIFSGDETFTILPIPFYTYSNYLGHNYGMVLFYENFLGTLTRFFFSAGRDNKNWDVNTRISEVKFLGLNWSLAYRQWWKTEEKKTGDTMILKYSWDTTDFSLGTGWNFIKNWNLGLTFNAVGSYNLIRWTQTLPADPFPTEGWDYGTTVTLGTGSLNWSANFRQGWTTSLSSGIKFKPEANEVHVIPNFSLSSTWLGLWGPFNVLVKGSGSWIPYGEFTGLAGNIRGVEDSLLWGDKFLNLRTATGVTLFDIPDWLEVQTWAFVDSGAAWKVDRPFSWDQVGLGSGVELLIFPHFFKSFIFRATLGFDLLRQGKIEFVLVDGLAL